MNASSDWLVVGGGVIGLMLTRELAARGARVTLVERGRLGQEASWAGGGIVSPLYPWRYPEAVGRLALEARDAYPRLADALHAETGVDIELRRSGLLMIDVEDAADAEAWAQRHRQQLLRIGADEAVRLQPGVRTHGEHALWMPDVTNVRNPRLLQALRTALERSRSVRLLEEIPVQGLLAEGERVTGVQTAAGPLQAGGTVICAGAWSPLLLNGIGVELPIVPVRGQMLLFEPAPGLLQRIVLGGGRYVIPRADGHVLAGSTLEYTGFDKRVTGEGYRSLHASALSLLPALADVPVKMHWSGLRPGAPDGIPFMGRVAPYEGLYLSAGHFRNGLVLAPAATRFMGRLLSDELPASEANPYDPAARTGGEKAETG